MPEKRGYKITAQYERLRLSDEAGTADATQGVAVTPLALSNAAAEIKETVEEAASAAAAAQETAEAALKATGSFSLEVATDEEVKEALDEIFG